MTTAAARAKPYPLAKLADALGIGVGALINRAGMPSAEATRARTYGVDAEQAIALARRFGQDPQRVWPGIDLFEPKADTPPQRNGAASDDDAWCDPPSGRSTSIEVKLAGELALCKTRPGTWRRISLYTSKSGATTARIKLAKVTIGFEFRAASVETGSGLWARYIGKG